VIFLINPFQTLRKRDQPFAKTDVGEPHADQPIKITRGIPGDANPPTKMPAMKPKPEKRKHPEDS
jgi:hypothetical protein